MNYHTKPPLKARLEPFSQACFTEQLFDTVIKSLSKHDTKKKNICYAIRQEQTKKIRANS
jgi:hypothetical protein